MSVQPTSDGVVTLSSSVSVQEKDQAASPPAELQPVAAASLPTASRDTSTTLLHTPSISHGTMLIPSSLSSPSSSHAAVSVPVAAAESNEPPQRSSEELLSPPISSNFSKSFSTHLIGTSLSAPPNQQNASSSRENTNKHSISMVPAPIETVQGAMLLSMTPSIHPSSSHPPSSTPSSHVSTQGEGESVEGCDLGNFSNSSAVSAVVAPSLNPSHPSSSSNTHHQHAVSTNTSSFSLAPSSSPHASSTSAAAQVEKTPEQVQIEKLTQEITKLIFEAKSNPSTSNSSSSSLYDLSSHCLVIHDHATCMQIADSPEAKKLKEAFSLHNHSDQPALQALITEWLTNYNIDMNKDSSQQPFIDTVYHSNHQVHINFSSHESMAAALLRYPFLVQCGCVQTGSWTGKFSKACSGSDKHKLPELLHFTCQPKPSSSAKKPLSSEDVKLILANMNLAFSTFWLPKEMKDPTRHSIYVLPRMVLLPSLQAEIIRLHLQHELQGAKIRVQGANSKALRRCNQCDQLGHESDECVIYSGVALRFLFHKPVAHKFMCRLKSELTAKTGFLGSSVNEMCPSRRMTFIIDPASWDEKQKDNFQQICVQLKQQKVLFEDPKVVDVKHRHQECKECGNRSKTHQCPFSSGVVNRPSSSRPLEKKIPEAGAIPDRMCRSWRKTKSCSNHMKNICRFEHPADHEAEQICHEFKKSGQCARDNCIFRHANPVSGTQAQARTLFASQTANKPVNVSSSSKKGSESNNSFQALDATDEVVEEELQEVLEEEKSAPQPLNASRSMSKQITPAPSGTVSSKKRKQVAGDSDENKNDAETLSQGMEMSDNNTQSVTPVSSLSSLGSPQKQRKGGASIEFGLTRTYSAGSQSGKKKNSREK
jgi:hypothetical protein